MTRTRFRLVAFALLCVLSGLSPGLSRQGAMPTDDERLRRFETQLEELRRTLHIPGLSAAVLRDQNVLWTKGSGYADIEGMVAATADTNYRIASLTKTFASTLLLQLVEQGTLDVDDPMAKHAPAFHERFKTDAVRVRHVFTHTSHDSPGENYRYDGNRFSYLTGVLESVTGRSFRGLLVRNILDRIDMTGSVPGQDVLVDRGKWSEFLDAEHAKRYEIGLSRLARPYRLYGTELVRAIYPPPGISASAGLISNVIDLAKYDVAVDRHTFLKPETQERAWTPAPSTGGGTLPYGLGWFIQRHQRVRLVWHYGYWPDSFSSLYLKVPEKNLSLILLANSDGLSAPFRLGNGDVTRSAFAGSFLRLFVFGDGDHAGAVGHDPMTSWLAERRASARSAIRVDPKTYDAYVGRYEVDSGESLTVTRDGDRLFASINTFEKVEVFPEAEHRFFGKAQEISLTFERDAAGRVEGVAIGFWGRRISAKKSK
jgi:CubicO group peptidase (beta-lactamase class C family)